MRLMLAANYDKDILPELARRSVTEIYGKLPHDVVGGGRPDYMAGALSRRKLEDYVRAVQREGMAFNYLLNSACLGNREWTRDFHKKLHRQLEWLQSIGVKNLTISTPYLMQLVKKYYPDFSIKVGIYAQVDTVKRARYWEDLGASAIVLESFSINRDFKRLEEIRAAVRCDLVLIANHFCQPNCPYQIQHQNGHAHSSGEHCSFYIDYPLIQCQYARLKRPGLMVAAQWIRPEDLARYEEMGFDHFKLLERNIPSSEVLKRVRAYQARRFDGNLAELIFSWGFKERAPDFNLLTFARRFKPWKMKAGFRKRVSEFMHQQGMLFPRLEEGRAPIEIRNQAMPPEFLDWFKRKNCADIDCASCNFCDKVAKTVVKFDPEFIDKVLPEYEAIQEELLDGSWMR